MKRLLLFATGIISGLLAIRLFVASCVIDPWDGELAARIEAVTR